jgi:hypothetical protein
MAYSDFTVHDLTARLGLRYVEIAELFPEAAPVAPGPVLVAVLLEGAPVALAISTEKARSELIIAPILMEARRQRGSAVSFFSGTELSVDPARGLQGFCDYMLALSPVQTELDAPVVAIVEAKNENIRLGIPQCAAEMYASWLFNEGRGATVPIVYGAVTTGSTWRFLRLRDGTIEVDLREYYLDAVDRILGVLVHMLALAEAARRPSASSAR